MSVLHFLILLESVVWVYTFPASSEKHHDSGNYRAEKPSLIGTSLRYLIDGTKKEAGFFLASQF